MTSWSYSSYSTAVQCLRKYKYIYIDKLVPDGAESSDLIFGSALHSAINAALTDQDAIAVFELYWMSYKEKEVDYGRFNWEQLGAIGVSFLKKFDKLHRSKYVLEFAEKRLYADYRGIRVEGTLDFYGVYNGKRSLRDFKTASRNYEPAKQDCALQIFLYSYLAIKNGLKAPETLGYTVFNKGLGSIQDLTWEFNEKEMYKALDDLVSYCSTVDNVKEHPRNLNACLDYNRKCQFWDKCHGERPNEEV